MKALWIITIFFSLVGIFGATARAASPIDATQVVEQFTSNLQVGRFSDAASMFSPAVKALVTATQLQEIWSSLPARLGDLMSIEAPYLIGDGSPARLRQPAVFAATPIDFSFAVDDKMQITEFTLVPHIERAVLEAATQVAVYVNTKDFTETELTFGTAQYPLKGTLSLPKGEGPFPAVVLVHGSGPNDRDETLGPNKPLRDLAWGLASRGVAVFRYDKRTLVYRNQMTIADVSLANEVTDDAVAAIRLMTEHSNVDPKRVFVLGHSLGGMLAPVIANQEPRTAGVIIMAGPVRPLYELMLDQYKYLFSLDGIVSAEEQAQLKGVVADVERVRQDQLPEDAVVLGAPAPYWRPFRTLDPVAEARQSGKPLLVLQGGRDYQVPQVTEFALWQQGLRGLSDVDFHTYSSLNHLFMSGEGMSTPQEYLVPGHVAGDVITDIAEWVTRH